MNAFKRKSLAAAVVTSLGALGSMQAGAVNIGTDNTGQVLLYPYYTTRAGYVTSMSVVNTTGRTKVVKVRFLEGQNSAEVLDFNLFLSPRDVWAGSIADNGTGGRLTTTDRSCTAPAIPAAGQPFTNIFYTGAAAEAVDADDGEGDLDRTREGYIEVIEMGVVDTAALLNDDTGTTIGPIVAAAVKHAAANGTPANCAVVQVDNLFGTVSGFTGLSAPEGGLAGEGIIIDAASGTEFAYNATALANFTTAILYNNPGTIAPSLHDADPVSNVFQDGAAAVVTSNWGAGVATGDNIDAVSAVLMHASVINEYEVGSAISGKTDWVVTMPTKRHYAWDNALPGGAALDSTSVAQAPFTRAFKSGADPQDNDGAATACETFFVQVYDREEAPYGSAPTIVFSPAPSGAGPNTANLCFETTVVTFVPNGGTRAAASVFNSSIAGTLTLPAIGANNVPDYSRGWARLTPVGTKSGQFLVGSAVTLTVPGISAGLYDNTFSYYGLPMIGFAAVKASAGAAGGLGGIFPHKFTTIIQ